MQLASASHSVSLSDTDTLKWNKRCRKTSWQQLMRWLWSRRLVMAWTPHHSWYAAVLKGLWARWVPRHLTPCVKEHCEDGCETFFVMLWSWKRWPSLTDKSVEMSAKYITSRQRQTKQVRIGNFLPLCSQRSSIKLHQLENLCSHSSGTVKSQSWNIIKQINCCQQKKHTVICLRITWNLHSGQNVTVYSVLVFCYSK